MSNVRCDGCGRRVTLNSKPHPASRLVCSVCGGRGRLTNGNEVKSEHGLAKVSKNKNSVTKPHKKYSLLDVAIRMSSEASETKKKRANQSFGAVAPSIALPIAARKKPPGATECMECGEEIPTARLKAQPGTRLCANCADGTGKVRAKRINESWGSREVWNRDRASWKRRH